MGGWSPSDSIEFRYTDEDIESATFRGFGIPFDITSFDNSCTFTITLSAPRITTGERVGTDYTIGGGDVANYKARTYACLEAYRGEGNEHGVTGPVADIGFDGPSGTIDFAGGFIAPEDVAMYFFAIGVRKASDGSIGTIVEVGVPATVLTSTLYASTPQRRDDLPDNANFGFYGSFDPPLPKTEFLSVLLLARSNTDVDQTGSQVDVLSTDPLYEWTGEPGYAETGWYPVEWQQEGAVAYPDGTLLPSVTVQTMLLEDDVIGPSPFDPNEHITWTPPPPRPPFSIGPGTGRGRFP